MNEQKISNEIHDNYTDYYSEGVTEWRTIGAIGKVQNIQTLCSELKISSVLEIGAGDGSVLQRLSDVDFANELYALEISQSGINAIKSRNISKLKDCILYDGNTIPFETNKFDLAVLSHVVEHLEFPRKLLYEASRIAKYVFVEVPLEDNLRQPKEFVFDSVGHINLYSPRSIRKLVQSCGLRVINQKVTNPIKETYVYEKGGKGLFSYFIKTLLLNTFPGLATRLFTYHSALVCTQDTNSYNGSGPSV